MTLENYDWFQKLTAKTIKDAIIDAQALKMLISSPRFQKMTVEDVIEELDANGMLRVGLRTKGR